MISNSGGVIMCRHCRVAMVAARNRLYCSNKCATAWSRQQAKLARAEFRQQIEVHGYSVEALALFERARAHLLAADVRAWFYRLSLDWVDQHPSRTPIRQDEPDNRDSRRIWFPEAHRRWHTDTRGQRRWGDFFSLREHFELPAVPVAGWYSVQLLGECTRGEPVVLSDLTEAAARLQVQLPSSPSSPRWRFQSWGSADLPSHRQKQAEKRVQLRAGKALALAIDKQGTGQ
jgi:hypothetical protein